VFIQFCSVVSWLCTNQHSTCSSSCLRDSYSYTQSFTLSVCDLKPSYGL